MNFVRIDLSLQNSRKDSYALTPDFVSDVFDSDLMVRGKNFYAVYNYETGLWSRKEGDVIHQTDMMLDEEYGRIKDQYQNLSVKYMRYYSTRSWSNFCDFIKKHPENWVNLDNTVTFLDTSVTKKDYVSKRLGYALSDADTPAYDELMSTLYEPPERAKLEWAIGSILTGHSKDIQKFLVLYGDAGSGKSTVLNIIQQLLDGYCSVFDARALGSSANAFATSVFQSNPLVAIQHDGDLSKIEDNSVLNSITAHEDILINEKHKAAYSMRINSMLFMGTNKPVKITDAKSGLIRRLIDVNPSGNKLPVIRYHDVVQQIKFELGGIARHCIEVFEQMGANYYSAYKPLDMIYRTDYFFNFVEQHMDIFGKEYVKLQQAYDLYKVWSEDNGLSHRMAKHIFRDELRNYFTSFERHARIDGTLMRSVYRGLKTHLFENLDTPKDVDTSIIFEMNDTSSILEYTYPDAPAQYASDNETPKQKWAEVTTTLLDIDTTQLHYVQLPKNHIVIDFDLKNENGDKDFGLNLAAASKWPDTYAEVSKGGSGIHLHYIYEGDVEALAPLYSPNIEVKIFKGGSALRRRRSKTRDIDIAVLSSGLPKKEKKRMVNRDAVKSENGIRKLIERNLRKEIMPGTKPSIDFIYKILEDAYSGNVIYDVSDLYQTTLEFAMNSTNQAKYCVELVHKMKWKSEVESVPEVNGEAPIVFFDIEVFPNVNFLNWKFRGAGEPIVRMINPSPRDVELLMRMNLVGFNCRQYDNHILYGMMLGYSVEEIFNLSQRIVGPDKQGKFREAYNISHTDVYDFASAGNKKSLKKWQVELGIYHKELGLPWDKPVPQEQWKDVSEYCDNDVISLEAVFEHLRGDYVGRQILAEMSGLTPNDTTNSHTTKIIFGNNRHPQSEFNIPDLSVEFPGYTFENGKSQYLGVDPKEGGRVWAKPGAYGRVRVADVASMHPYSIIAMNLFGPYTQYFADLVQVRIWIKHKDLEPIRTALDGRIWPFIERALAGEFTLKDVSNALKTAINSVYGQTFTTYDNPFKDPRNKDNVVAKRGALFMTLLQHELEKIIPDSEEIVHIKTDSIKIANCSDDTYAWIEAFGQQYGYVFEMESEYDKFVLVNDSTYVARKPNGEYETVGAQFAHPYVFKTLFSHEPVTIDDYAETKSVSNAALYFGPEHEDPTFDNSIFVGKVGSFIPVVADTNGHKLYRVATDKFNAAPGTKGYLWRETYQIKELQLAHTVDTTYHQRLADQAVADISAHCDYEWFVSDKPYDPDDNEIHPF